MCVYLHHLYIPLKLLLHLLILPTYVTLGCVYYSLLTLIKFQCVGVLKCWMITTTQLDRALCNKLFNTQLSPCGGATQTM